MKRRKLMNGIKYIVLIVLACIYLIPIIMMLLGSVKDPAQAMLFDLSWPETFHWDNYSYVIEEGNILNGYKNSLLITGFATFFTILFGGIAGIIIGRRIIILFLD